MEDGAREFHFALGWGKSPKDKPVTMATTKLREKPGREERRER